MRNMTDLWERLSDKLRGARRIEIVAALVIAALLGLALLNGISGAGQSGGTPLEERLERILSRIDGVGRVSAMITEDGEGGVAGVPLELAVSCLDLSEEVTGGDVLAGLDDALDDVAQRVVVDA